MSAQVIELASARRARGLPLHPNRIKLWDDPSARVVPAPGKRTGCRVFIVDKGVFGTVWSWRPDIRRGGCMLAVNSGGMIYCVHEAEVQPAPDAA